MQIFSAVYSHWQVSIWITVIRQKRMIIKMFDDKRKFKTYLTLKKYFHQFVEVLGIDIFL